MTTTRTDTTTELACRVLAALQANDFRAWEAALADDFRAHYPGSPNLDAAGAKAFNAVFPAAFPDLIFEIQQVIVDGDTVVIRAEGTGTFTHPLTTPQGIVAPNGRVGRVPLILMTTLRGDRIVEERTFWDRMDLFQQLGLA